MSEAIESGFGPVMTTEQLARRWEVSPGTLVNWRSQGKGPCYIRLGTGGKASIRYRLRDIEEYEQQQTVERSKHHTA